MRRKRDIIIELTSLLDVIMIMIFMVMTENSKLITEKQSSLDDLTSRNTELSSTLTETQTKLDEAQGKLDEGSVEELLDRLQKAESKLESYEYMEDVVTVINIGLENRYANSVRTLTFGTTYDSQNSDEQIIEIRSAEDLSAAINKMRVFIHDHISKTTAADESAIVYMVFTYNPAKVYQDDYAAVNEALNQTEIRANSGNVRYRINRISI